MPDALKSLIAAELETDGVWNDVTTALLGPTPHRVATVVAKQRGCFSGTQVVAALEALLQPELRVEILTKEGEPFEPGQGLVRLEGAAGTLLKIERTLLNFLTHLCGVATLTREYVEAVRPYGVKILATRKTLPGLRALELQAVQAGGGYIHRRSLSDGILIKENHQEIGPVKELIHRAHQARSPLHRIEVEVQRSEDLASVLEAAPDVIMLDNFTLPQIRDAITQIGDQAAIEVSGGVTLETVGEIAATGIHYISIGRITHSAPAVDLSLEISPHA